MNPSQLRFLAFHHKHTVACWRWHFLGTQLRATSERGRSVTIWKDDLSELLEAGLLRASHGASVQLTALGRDVSTRCDKCGSRGMKVYCARSDCRLVPDDCLRAMANVPVRRPEIPNRLKGATVLENGDVT